MHIDKAGTTIRVKIGTRNLIQDRSLPGESLEDTMVRMKKSNSATMYRRIPLRITPWKL